MLSQLNQFSQHRLSWGLLLLSAIGLFTTALWFQHYKQLEPCLLCIYIRVAVLGVAVAATVGLMMPRYIVARIIGLIGWIGSAAWGLSESLALVAKQAKSAPVSLFSNTCDYIPNFPSWMPLHQWIPEVFQPRGQCGDEAWIWMGLSMAQWMVIAFASYLVVAAVISLSQFSRTK
ncbi:disulfide bond formation protein DsbB [uncultured Ferrimonas sp.]|uniref:disulfide bond formation protein DsbB n=1 Tax=uncultured Ferrimonas sp. TaxID=432640 RepID=UPI00260D136D|nr:disulfide bond formation protein DsbB [uncultured Ferrimonas sp.]